MQSKYYYLFDVYTHYTSIFRCVLARCGYISFYFWIFIFLQTVKGEQTLHFDIRPVQCIREATGRVRSLLTKFYLQMLKCNVNLGTMLQRHMMEYQHHNRPQLLPLNQKQYTKDHVEKVHNEGGKWKHFMLLVKKLNKSWIYIPHTTYAYVW